MIHPSYILRVGNTRCAPFQHTGHEQTVSFWLSVGFMYLYGWELDENMDEDDAMFLLEPALNNAVSERHCPSWDCNYQSEDGTILVLHHLHRTHGWSIHLLTAWMHRVERPLADDFWKEGLPTPNLN